ncbi:MAG: thiol reductant ABC exporter subunit CydD [Verrucomicrobiota bacterium]
MRVLDPDLIRRVRGVGRLLAVDTVLGVVAAALVLLQATLLARVVARSFDGATLSAVAGTVAAFVAVVVARAGVAWGFEAVGRLAAVRAISDTRMALVESRLVSHPAALDRTESGEVAAAAVAGTDALETTFGRYLPQLVLACVVPPVVLVWVAVIDLESAALMLLTLPLVPVFMWLIGRYTERRTRERYAALALLSRHFLDVIRGLPTLRAFNRGEVQAASLAEVGDRYRRTTMATLRSAFLSGAVLELAATIGVALVAVTVGVRLVDGGIGFQSGLTVLVLVPELYLPIRTLGARYHAGADGMAVLERILALTSAGPPTRAGVVPPSPAEEPVRLEGVWFSYPARAREVLCGLDLELRPGETLALVGETGAGKSSVAAALLRFVEPDAGRVTVGGLDLADADVEAWRRLVAWVPQRPTLVRGSIADNIRLGGADATDAEVAEAARRAGADRIAPPGTVVGEGGRPLSAGELQRIALARAFLRDAPLVILDEPTANLDAASAEIVADAVERLCVDRTVLLIAHRPELAARADRVVRMTDGRAVDEVAA